MTPFSIPIAAAILSEISLSNVTVSKLLIEGFTSKRKKYFQQKCNHINEYLNKLVMLFVKIQEDGQISPDEFNLIQKLLMDSEKRSSLKTAIKSKDIKKVIGEQKRRFGSNR